MSGKHLSGTLPTPLAKRQRQGRHNARAEKESIQQAIDDGSTANCTSELGFFDLSREIRDQIYDETWKQCKAFGIDLPSTLVRRTHYRFQVYYGDRKRSSETASSKDFAWVFASGQMFAEASEQFESKARWRDGTTTNKYGRSFSAWRPYQRRHPDQPDTPVLLNIYRASHVVVDRVLWMFAYYESKKGRTDALVVDKSLRRVDSRPGFNYRPRNPMKTPADFTTNVLFDPTAEEFLSDFANGLLGSTSLRSLTMCIGITPRWEVCAEHHIDVDLQVLKGLKLPNLQVLKLTLRGGIDSWGDERVMQEFRKEIERVAKTLLGGDVLIEYEPRQDSPVLRSPHPKWTFTKNEEKD